MKLCFLFAYIGSSDKALTIWPFKIEFNQLLQLVLWIALMCATVIPATSTTSPDIHVQQTGEVAKQPEDQESKGPELELAERDEYDSAEI